MHAAPYLATLLAAHPSVAFASLAAGLAAIYWEACAPGRVVPGAAGAALFISGAWCLGLDHPTGRGLALLALGVALLSTALLGAGENRGLRFALGASGAIVLAAGSVFLIPPPHSIHAWVAIPVSLALSAVALYGGRLALLARANKLIDGPR